MPAKTGTADHDRATRDALEALERMHSAGVRACPRCAGRRPGCRHCAGAGFITGGER